MSRCPPIGKSLTSGTGLRGFGYGRKPGGRCRAGDFEMYASGRYLCITGHHLDGTPDDALSRCKRRSMPIYAQMFPPQDTPDLEPTARVPTMMMRPSLSTPSAREIARNSARLFDDGDISTYDGDHSRADLALCRLIAFYTQDPEQVDRLFRLSALYRGNGTAPTIATGRSPRPSRVHQRHWRGVSAESNGQPLTDRR